MDEGVKNDGEWWYTFKSVIAFGKIRTLIINGDPWFILADICKVLEISNSRMVAGRLDEDELMSVRLTAAFVLGWGVFYAPPFDSS